MEKESQLSDNTYQSERKRFRNNQKKNKKPKAQKELVGVKKPYQASIQRIEKIVDIVGRDYIGLASVLGWDTIVNKSDFNVGDLCVWHEPDTIVDKTNPVYEFLEKYNYYVGSMRMYGVVTSGLAMPLSKFEDKLSGVEKVVGTDVTDHIGILHMIKPTDKFTREDKLENWPVFLVKTDQANFRSEPGVLDELKAQDMLVYTQKMDGTSATYFYRSSSSPPTGMCSRNHLLSANDDQKPTSDYSYINTKYNILKRLEKYGKNIAIQGEICGPKINGNHVGLDERMFYIFDIWDIDEQAYVGFFEMCRIIAELNGIFPDQEKLRHVPVIKHEKMTATQTKDDIERIANQEKYFTGRSVEGIVIKPTNETVSALLKGRLSVKILSTTYIQTKKVW